MDLFKATEIAVVTPTHKHTLGRESAHTSLRRARDRHRAGRKDARCSCFSEIVDRPRPGATNRGSSLGEPRLDALLLDSYRGVMTSLAAALDAGTVVLDGGLATYLESQGHDLSSDLWSARLLRDDPAAIRDAHRAYFDAGAQVATTASYQASYEGFEVMGTPDEQTTELLRESVRLAAEVRASYSDDVTRWVAASIGPYGAFLADGSEYRGDYNLDVLGLRRWHRPRLDVLVGAGADVLALETIPCLAEVEALLTEVIVHGVDCWLSLTCSGGRTRAGEPLDEAFRAAGEVDEVIAVGVNCTDPREATDLTRMAAELSGKPVVVYPNSIEAWDSETRSWSGPKAFLPSAIFAWQASGARLIGGCCRVGPAEIAGIVEALKWSPHSASQAQNTAASVHQGATLPEEGQDGEGVTELG